MNLILHESADSPIAEVVSDTIILQKEQDVIPLLEEIFASGAYKVILHKENIDPVFFDLSTGLAGAVLQKFVNYNIQLAIVGDFSPVNSNSLKAFIYESNRGSQIFFLGDFETAIHKLHTASQ